MPVKHFKSLRLGFVLNAVATCSLCSCSLEPQLEITSDRTESASAAPIPEASVKPGPEDADAPKEFVKTDSGLKYRILRKSDGRKPTASQDKSDTVSVHYKGWLDNGNEFDGSYKRGEPTEFALNGVIKGWTEGLQYVGEGGMIELEIPSYLGYGAEGKDSIPPNATLHFLVELLKVK